MHKKASTQKYTNHIYKAKLRGVTKSKQQIKFAKGEKHKDSIYAGFTGEITIQRMLLAIQEHSFSRDSLYVLYS